MFQHIYRYCPRIAVKDRATLQSNIITQIWWPFKQNENLGFVNRKMSATLNVAPNVAKTKQWRIILLVGVLTKQMSNTHWVLTQYTVHFASVGVNSWTFQMSAWSLPWSIKCRFNEMISTATYSSVDEWSNFIKESSQTVRVDARQISGG